MTHALQTPLPPADRLRRKTLPLGVRGQSKAFNTSRFANEIKNSPRLIDRLVWSLILFPSPAMQES